MALYTTPDGRVVIGTGVSDGNDYHGYNGKRDIVIQLTEDGATTDGLNALEYLKSYAENAKAENKPIFPDGTRVFISTNGYTKAVEADDVVIDGENISIGGIVWNGSAWDFSNAGQSGGGSGGGVLVLNVTVDNATGEATLNKTWNEIYTASATMPIIIVLHKDGVGERFTQYILVDRVTNSNRETGTRQYTVYAHIELLSDNNPIAFIADSEDGYPSATLE